METKKFCSSSLKYIGELEIEDNVEKISFAHYLNEDMKNMEENKKKHCLSICDENSHFKEYLEKIKVRLLEEFCEQID